MVPLVSIVTVTMNCAATIERTLESVREIKTPAVEYIVIDGNSTDGTLETLRRFPDVVDVLVSEPDSGVYNAMNKGATRASGRYVLFLNGDDCLRSDGFVRALDILRNEGPKILSCRSDVGQSTDIEPQGLVPRPHLLPFFNSIPHLSTFIATEVMQSFGYREDLRIASDYDLFLRLYLRGYRFRTSELVTAIHYRGGISGDVVRSNAEIETVKRENLGPLYFFVSFLMWINRKRKRLLAAAAV